MLNKANITTKYVNKTYEKIQRVNLINIENSHKKQLITVRFALGGNVIITLSKLIEFLHSGFSAMMSESVHSVVDYEYQSPLLVGLCDSGNCCSGKKPSELFYELTM